MRGIIASIQKFTLSTTQEIADNIICAGIRTDQPINHTIPLIGLKKDPVKEYYITTNKDDLINVSKWADYVAIDSRIGNREKEYLYAVAHTMDIKLVADVEKLRDVESILDMCISLKIQCPYYFATTFSKMDIELIKQIKNITEIPIIAEGGYNNIVDIKKAFEYGAQSVCIGAAFDIRNLLNKYNKLLESWIC